MNLANTSVFRTMSTKCYRKRLRFVEDMTKHCGVFSVHSVVVSRTDAA